MSRLSEFFLNSRSRIVQLELIEVTHPSFSQPYRFVRNCVEGVTVDLSDTEQDIFFQFYPAKVSAVGSRDDLDAGVQIQLGDLGEIIPEEIDNVDEAGAMLTKPAVRYWVYRSDDLTSPMYGPLHLEAPTFTLDYQGAAFQAQAPQVNNTSTGERYKLDRFPMLRGFL
jgi:hypothetical protein